VTKTDDLEFAFSYVDKLIARRQATTSFYLSVNTGILAVMGLLFKDAHLTGIWLVASLLLLLCAGFLVCWVWRSLLSQYEILLDWWYARVRELEAHIPDSARLVSREYNELYKTERPGRKLSTTKLLVILNWMLSGLYVAFAVGLVWYWLS
jgi:hypothetical protein